MKKFLIITTLIATVGFVLYLNISRLNLDILAPTESPAEEQLVLIEPDEVFAEPIMYGALKQSYSHATFSFNYSEGFKILLNQISATELAPSRVEGEIITVENSKGSGFQILITSFDEPGPITPERIWQDEPEADIIDPKWADLDGIKTIAFYGYNEDMGETFEVWPIYKGKLYQIAGPKTAEDLIVETLETWRWIPLEKSRP